MQTRTLYALLATGLLLATGVVVAQSPDKPTDTQTTTPQDPAFMMKLSPGEAWVRPGGSATVSILFEARTEKTLKLTVRGPEGVSATLSSDEVDVTPAGTSKAHLTLVAPQDATRSPYVVYITATDETGNVRHARAALHVNDVTHKSEPKATARAQDRNETKSEPKPPTIDNAAYEKRVDHLERRLNALLERAEKLLARAHDIERPAAKPEPVMAARMTLADERTTIPAAGGKVALLFAGGDHDARVQLIPRYNESAGWKVSLEREVVEVGAHERAWIWVSFTPGENAGPLEYAIIQVDTTGPYAVQGLVSLATG